MPEAGAPLTVTVLLPPEPGVPVVVFDGNAALRMAIVDRQSVGALDESWEASGVYLLLDPVEPDGAYRAYVGRAPAGLRARLREHASGRGKDHWVRALLVVRDTTHGWHSAQVGWLEVRLYDLLDGATLARLVNSNRPQDETLPPYERAALEAAVEPVAAVLRLLGCSPDTFDEESPGQSTPPDASKTYYGMTVAELIEAGDLRAGERLSSTQLSAPGSAVVGPTGSLTVEGEVFTSPSAAGAHVRAGKATNGWSFWAAERDGTTVPLATIRARYLRRQKETSGAADAGP